MASGDLDGDGRVDVVINNIDSKPAILKNVTQSGGHWVAIRLVGDIAKKTSTDAIGATAYVTANKIRQRQDVISGTSYASQNDLTLHFGLGSATRIDKLEVRWPNGVLETVAIQSIDRKVTVVQGKGVVK
jgi:hypothetical protein